MAITKQQLLRKVKARVSALRGEAAKPVRADDFERLLGPTLREVAIAAWGAVELRTFVTHAAPYSVTFVAGYADLTQAGLEDLLVESVPDATLRMAAYSRPFDPVENLTDIYLDQGVRGIVQYVIAGLQIIARDPDMGLDVVDGVATMRGAGFVPTVKADATGTLDPALEPMLIEMMAHKLTERTAGGGAASPAEGGTGG